MYLGFHRPMIPGSTSKIFSDFGFDKQKFLWFRNPDSFQGVSTLHHHPFPEESVTSRSHGSKSSGWQQQGAYDDGKGNKNGKKRIGLYSKTTTLHTQCYTFFSHHCTTATWNFLISRARFMVGKHNIKMHGLFLNLDAVLSDLTPENFAKIWQIKWNWIILTRFETVRIHILSEVFGLLSSRKFAIMATWLI